MYHKIIRRLLPPAIDYRSVVFFTTDITTRVDYQFAIDETPGYLIFDSAAGDIMQSLCRDFPGRCFESRMRSEDQKCYVAMIDALPVAFGWVTESDCHVSEVHMTLPIAKYQFYIYDCFVFPAHRGRGIYRKLLKRILYDYLGPVHPSSSTLGFICVVPENTASIKGVLAAGFRKAAQIHYLRIGSKSYIFGKDALLQQLGS